MRVSPDVTLFDQRLHDVEKRDVLRSARIVILNAEQLLDADLQSVSFSDVLFQRVQVTRQALAFCVVLVHDSPTITDIPAIDPVMSTLWRARHQRASRTVVEYVRRRFAGIR